MDLQTGKDLLIFGYSVISKALCPVPSRSNASCPLMGPGGVNPGRLEFMEFGRSVFQGPCQCPLCGPGGMNPERLQFMLLRELAISKALPVAHHESTERLFLQSGVAPTFLCVYMRLSLEGAKATRLTSIAFFRLEESLGAS